METTNAKPKYMETVDEALKAYENYILLHKQAFLEAAEESKLMMSGVKDPPSNSGITRLKAEAENIRYNDLKDLAYEQKAEHMLEEIAALNAKKAELWDALLPQVENTFAIVQTLLDEVGKLATDAKGNSIFANVPSDNTALMLQTCFNWLNGKASKMKLQKPTGKPMNLEAEISACETEANKTHTLWKCRKDHGQHYIWNNQFRYQINVLLNKHGARANGLSGQLEF